VLAPPDNARTAAARAMGARTLCIMRYLTLDRPSWFPARARSAARPGPHPKRRARSDCSMRAIDLRHESVEIGVVGWPVSLYPIGRSSAQSRRYACRVVSNLCHGPAPARPHTCSDLRQRAEEVGGGGGSRTRVFRDVSGASPSASGN
jgi:hypothetical protein